MFTTVCKGIFRTRTAFSCKFFVRISPTLEMCPLQSLIRFEEQKKKQENLSRVL